MPDVDPADRRAGPAADPALAGRSFLVVLAHPDDESLACGGTLARLADAGARVVLLCASRGERGSVSDAALLTDSDLASVRAGELHHAAAVLGIAEVLVMHHADGNLRWESVTELHQEIVEAIERTRPEAVITFDEDGLYWHLDHIGVHERTYTAVRSLGAAAPPLYYVTMPRGAVRQIVEAARASGAPSTEGGVWGISPEIFGHAAEPPDFVVDVHAWVPRKLTALRCHRTQLGVDNPFAWISDDDARRWLGVEQFRRAPMNGARGSLLESLARPGGPEA